MKAEDITALAQLGQLRASNPALQAYVDAAIAHLAGVPRKEDRRRAFAYYGVVGTFLFVSAATCIVTILATVKVLDVDTDLLKMMWGAFIIELVPLGAFLVKQAFNKG